MRLYAFHEVAPQSVVEWPSFAAKYGRPPIMPHLRCYRLVLLSVVAVVTAAVSTIVSSFRFSASLRPQGVNSETFQPPCLPHYSPYQASVARFFVCSSPLSLATSASSAAIASCRGVTPSCTPCLSVAYRPHLEERHYCQITPFFTDVKGPLCCFQSFILWKQTHQGHVRRRMNTLHLSWGCSIEDLSPFPASPPSHQRCLKFTGLSCGKRLSVEERNTAENAAVCDCGCTKELRAGYECSYRHPLSDDTAWRTTAFLAARHIPASCTLTVQQQLGTSPASSTSRAPRRRPHEARSPHQSEPLSAVTGALRPLLRKTSPPASGCAPLGLKPIPVKEGESPVRARVNYTLLKAAGSPGGGGFQRTLNVWQDRCVTRRLFVRPEQSKWKTVPNVKSGQALRTSLDGAAQKIPLETSTDIGSVKYVSREHAVDKSHQIFVLGGDVGLARGTLDASEQQHVGPPDKVLLGEKRGRLTVTLSNNHVHACVVDNRMQRTYAYASSFDKCLLPEIGAIRRRRGLKPRPHGGTMKAAWAVGRLVAQRALAKGIKKVFFDRKSYRYIGRVKALADGAREGGLEF